MLRCFEVPARAVSLPRSLALSTLNGLVIFFGIGAFGCSESPDPQVTVEDVAQPDSLEEELGNEQDSGTDSHFEFNKGTKVITTTGLHLRSQPSAASASRAVMPERETVRIVGESPQDGWYNINFDGIVGWASGSYLEHALTPSSEIQHATARALSSWGFSYHWGGGDWDPTSQEAGACSGSCPDCTHEGQHGADCSGMIAKAWVVPETNAPTTKVSHPYSTRDFIAQDDKYPWTRVPLTSLKEGDAMVYRKDGAGHIFYVYGKDPWGKIQAVECKGSAEGCLYNIRSSTGYVAIRRDGF